MKRYFILIIILFLPLFNCKKVNLKFDKFGVVYGKISPVETSEYNLLILEPDHYRKYEVEAFKNSGKLVIAYVSLGEVNRNRWYYPLIPAAYFYGKNPNWDAQFLNISQSEVVKLFLDKIIPNILAKGFDGLFFDTVDDVAPGTKGEHLQEDMVDLIRKIRKRFPQTILIQNAGLFLIDEVADVIDGVLVEDVVSSYNFKNKTYSLKSENEATEKIQKLKEIWNRFELPVLIVDFASDVQMKKVLEKKLKQYEFPFFISTIDLQKLPDYR